ncbi:MAG: succinate dehydrogenase cytochrome b subunit [Bacteroidota bacterium]|nr:succinate dehydrogenase cytochrome b subunit [Bacteroidota bacterium]
MYSSITKKVIMSLMGLFLITFLLVHLSLNLTLIISSSKDTFNLAAHFMGTNPVVKVLEVVLFGGFIIHIFWGIVLFFQNWAARPHSYAVWNHSQETFFSKYMIHTGALILAFLAIHLLDFWYKSRFSGGMPITQIDGIKYDDMGQLVLDKFKSPAYCSLYVIFLIFMGFHLDHAFQSALQSLGINHSKYTPFFKKFSRFLAVVITIGYISIPIVIYFIL